MIGISTAKFSIEHIGKSTEENVSMRTSLSYDFDK